jgi:hypothetical protein
MRVAILFSTKMNKRQHTTTTTFPHPLTLKENQHMTNEVTNETTDEVTSETANDPNSTEAWEMALDVVAALVLRFSLSADRGGRVSCARPRLRSAI